MPLPRFPPANRCRNSALSVSMGLPMIPRFRDKLAEEFADRRQKNTRYSLRAFAAFLETDHSTLSQVLRGRRGVTTPQIRAWARKLNIDSDTAAAYVAAEHLDDESSRLRANQLRHWTAEAIAIAAEPVHWRIVKLCRMRGSRPDSRWIASQTGAGVDQVNVALARLLRLRLIEMRSPGGWADLLPAAQTERDFRRIALSRIRRQAAEHDVVLPRLRDGRT